MTLKKKIIARKTFCDKNENHKRKSFRWIQKKPQKRRGKKALRLRGSARHGLKSPFLEMVKSRSGSQFYLLLDLKALPNKK